MLCAQPWQLALPAGLLKKQIEECAYDGEDTTNLIQANVKSGFNAVPCSITRFQLDNSEGASSSFNALSCDVFKVSLRVIFDNRRNISNLLN
jgi:hypothetical protein